MGQPPPPTLEVCRDGSRRHEDDRARHHTVLLSVRRFEIAAGRFFELEDHPAVRRVAVRGARVTDTLFEGQHPVGQEIRIRGVPFEVIGVLQAKGTTADGADLDNRIPPIQALLRT